MMLFFILRSPADCWASRKQIKDFGLAALRGLEAHLLRVLVLLNTFAQALCCRKHDFVSVFKHSRSFRLAVSLHARSGTGTLKLTVTYWHMLSHSSRKPLMSLFAHLCVYLFITFQNTYLQVGLGQWSPWWVILLFTILKNFEKNKLISRFYMRDLPSTSNPEQGLRLLIKDFILFSKNVVMLRRAHLLNSCLWSCGVLCGYPRRVEFRASFTIRSDLQQ